MHTTQQKNTQKKKTTNHFRKPAKKKKAHGLLGITWKNHFSSDRWMGPSLKDLILAEKNESSREQDAEHY